MVEEIETQKSLLRSHKICDAKIQGNASIFADFNIDDNYIKGPKNRSQILQPKTRILKDNPQEFIRDILEKELIESLSNKLENKKNSLEW